MEVMKARKDRLWAYEGIMSTPCLLPRDELSRPRHEHTYLHQKSSRHMSRNPPEPDHSVLLTEAY